jgi:hypothetical protein
VLWSTEEVASVSNGNTKIFAKVCHQFAVMGEREPIKKPKLGHKIENKRMNKSLNRSCALLPMSSKQFMFIITLLSHSRCCSLLHGPDSAFIFFHPCCCFCFCSWVSVL